MKRTNVDLIVGASIILAVCILVGGVLWLKDVAVSQKLVTYTVLFPNVGSLQVGDPVSVNGVNLGTVGKIKLRNETVAVILKVEKNVSLTDSCRVVVQNIGLMGERGIGIILSPRGVHVKPNTSRDTTYMHGYFDTGIAEAMGMLGTVLGQVEVLVQNVSTIVNSTVGDTAFLTLFHTMAGRLDTLTIIADRIVVRNEPLIDKSVQNISTVSTDLKGMLNRNSGHIDTIMKNGDQLTTYALTIAARLDSLSYTVKTMVDRVDRGEGTLGMLMKDEHFYHDLKGTVGDLDTLVNEVHNDALKLRIKFGFAKPKKSGP